MMRCTRYGCGATVELVDAGEGFLFCPDHLGEELERLARLRRAPSGPSVFALEERRRELERAIWERPLGCSRSTCEGLADGLLDGEPLCLEHADEELERWVAVVELPALRALLPSLEDSAGV